MLLLATPAFAQSGETRDIAATLETMRQEKRVALVVGNSAYPDARLRNPVNDAEVMTRALEGMGFTVLLRKDAGGKEMKDAIAEFAARIRAGGVGLFFFAGHGMQYGGNNYLIPVDVPIPTERDMDSLLIVQMIDIDLVLGRMEKAKNRVNIVILDASRDNPFGRRFRSSAPGLASMDAPPSTLIAYAAAPGRLARDDGAGDHTIYTGTLLKVLQEPGLKIEDAFNRVRQQVHARTSGQQVPWKSSSLTGDFYFILPRLAALPKPEPESVRIPVDVGSVSILGKLDGIEVWLGDQKIGETQAGLALVVNKLLPGTYRVRAHKSGYKEWERQVQVAAKRQADVLIDLEKAISERPKVLGSLAIVGRVPGAEVWLGSEKVGETRSGSELVVDNLEPGNYVLQARRPGYRDWQRQVQVGPNQRVQVVIDIEPILEPPVGKEAAKPEPKPDAKGGPKRVIIPGTP